MNAKIAVAGIVIALVLAGGYLFIGKNSTPPVSVAPQTNSRYISYSQGAFDAAADKKRVFFFFAPWCPTCVPTDKEFQAAADRIPEDVVLLKTDYDSSTELKKQYAITYQHTFVLVDAQGREIEKWNGGALAELIAHTQ